MDWLKLHVLSLLLTFSFSQETITIQGIVDGLIYIPECMCAPVGVIDINNDITALGINFDESIAFQNFIGMNVVATGIPTTYPCSGFCNEEMSAIDVFTITLVEETCVSRCDVNYDDNSNVLDIVTMVNFALMLDIPTSNELCASDFDQNENINVLDIIHWLWSCFAPD